MIAKRHIIRLMFDFFDGGLHLKKQQNTMNLAIEVMPIPQKVYIPFSQHQGKPAIPVVKPGDSVRIGTVLGEPDQEISSFIHSSISGTVISVEKHPHPTLGSALCCVIESDFADNWETRFIDSDYQSLGTDELLDRIGNAGIVGLGGGAFPTEKKLRQAAEKGISLLIINGCESEPNIYADYRLMIEYPMCVIEGARMIQKIIGAPRVIFVISRSYTDAAKLFKKEGVEINIVSDRYPQGYEKMLVKKITKKDVPTDKLPIDIGCVVQNVSTCYAVFQAVKYNKPMIERVVTVSGDAINESKNLLVKMGTPISDVIQFCGGLKSAVKKVIFGGVMTGMAQFALHTPVIKSTNAIVFQKEYYNEEMKNCVCCGFCIDTCPAKLMPQVIFAKITKNLFNEAIDYGLNKCLECGSCAYVCPANIPLINYFRNAKIRTARG